MQDYCKSSNGRCDIKSQLAFSCQRIMPSYWVLLCPALVVLLIGTGCSADRHIRTLSEGRYKGERFQAVRALADEVSNKRATEALIAALKDPKASVRFAAAEALDRHFAGRLDPTTRKAALLSLVDVLDDTGFDTVCLPLYGPFLPGLTCTTPSVRSRALLTLASSTRKDFGLDKRAWREEIENRFGETEHRTADRENEIAYIDPGR